MIGIYIAAILTSAALSLAGAQTSRVAIGLSPVPLWPPNGDTSQLPKDRYIFYDLRAGEYVAFYPTNFAEPDTGERTTMRFGTHSLVDPHITSTNSVGANGTVHYAYVVANGSQARQPIQELTLLVPTGDQAAQFQAGAWNVTRMSEQVRDIASPLTPVAPVEFSAVAGQAIAPGAQGPGFSVDSSYLPGFAQVSAKGAISGREYTAEAAAQLPSVVRDQLAAVFTPAWDSQTRTVLGPRFRRGASQFEIAQNLLHGIDVLVVHRNLDGDSAFLAGARSLLKSFLQADGSAPISANQFDSLPQPKPGLETEIAMALQIDFAP